MIVDRRRVQNLDQFNIKRGGYVLEIEKIIGKHGRTMRELYPIIKDRLVDVNVKKG